MKITRQNVGVWGEKKAAEYLFERGYKILAKNVRTVYGEIDIAAQKNGIYVFVEVKTRKTRTFGYPEDSITRTKKEHMVNSAQEYMMTHADDDDIWQIDVISIEVLQPDFYKIYHFENAIRE